jgi:hypothetical protein
LRLRPQRRSAGQNRKCAQSGRHAFNLSCVGAGAVRGSCGRRETSPRLRRDSGSRGDEWATDPL